jgi:hypothetical protein
MRCQKCGLVAGVVIGYFDEVNGVRIGRAAWCCPRCVNRALERIEQLEEALDKYGAHDLETCEGDPCSCGLAAAQGRSR